MAKRIPQEQSQHDRKVRQQAQQLRRQGWKVRADVPGFEQPDGIGQKGFIPDIQATKKGAERLIEVETESTIDTDKEQHTAFRRRAAHRPRTTFQIEEAGNS